VIIQPLATWLWIGGGVMAGGTVLAAWPGQRRRPTDPVSSPLPGVESPEADPAADLPLPARAEPPGGDPVEVEEVGAR
jgi:cytochrome c-type biogenesis protein CcmF